MKAPNHGVCLMVWGSRPFESYVGYPVYKPEDFGYEVAGHIFSTETESPIVAFFTTDRIVMAK